jgi:hypothetical protein
VNLTIQYIRDAYNLNVKIGDYITFTGLNAARRARVISAPRQYLRVRFCDTGEIALLHPTWEVEYE